MNRNPSGIGAWIDFYDEHRFLRSSKARAVGLSREWLSQAARLGEIVKVLPGLYRKADQPWDRTTRLEVIGRVLPHATVTLTTALILHGALYADESDLIWLCFDRDTYIPDLSGLGARAVRSRTASEPRDVRHIRVGRSQLRVHSIARAVVECFRFRERLGIRLAIDAMEAALNAFACHPAELREVARRCRVERVVRSHLASWSRRESQAEAQGRKRPGRPRRRRDRLPLVGELAWQNGTLPQVIADRAILPPPRRPSVAPRTDGDDDHEEDA